MTLVASAKLLLGIGEFIIVDTSVIPDVRKERRKRTKSSLPFGSNHGERGGN